MDKHAEENRFVQYLVTLGLDRDKGESRARAALATLRKGLGKPPGTDLPSLAYIVPRLPSNSRRHDHYFLVAALFASHPTHSASVGGIGDTFRQVAEKVHSGGVDGTSTERRFVQLLDAHREELPLHLRHAISLARSRDKVPVNYTRLLYDLGNWDQGDRRVQRQWASEFWTRKDASGMETNIVAGSTAVEGA
ncbi:MAG: type I-E CRISPR-associated protein Cse2/CasB [Candidatus Competibacteraceae bacterium]|nr:type I-E CRISPR-associated protein Cse2/CasB [Candidatus Competibacteraceae bacterium]